MHFWSAIVLIVAIVAVSKVLRGRHRAMARIAEIRGDGAESAALNRELVELRSRVAVLERIVTDTRASQSLAHEIEALRNH